MTSRRQILTALALLASASACIEPPTEAPHEEDADMSAVADMTAVDMTTPEDMALDMEDMALDMEDMSAEDMPPDVGGEADADMACISDEEFDRLCTIDTCGQVFEVCNHGQKTCACEVKFAVIEDDITPDWSTEIALGLDGTTVITPGVCVSTKRDACRACKEATWTPGASTEDILRAEPVDGGPPHRVIPHGVGTFEVDSVCEGEVAGTLELEILAPDFHANALNLWLRAGYGYNANVTPQKWEAAAPAGITMESDPEVTVSAAAMNPATLSLAGSGGWYGWDEQDEAWNLDASEATIILVFKNDKSLEERSILARRCSAGDTFTIGYGVPNVRQNTHPMHDYTGGSHRWLEVYNKIDNAPDEHSVQFYLPGTTARLHILTIILKAPGRAPQVFQNGQETTPIMGKNSTSYFAGEHVLDRLLGPCSPMNSKSNFEGEVGEVLIYDRALPPTERETIERYLQRKYRIIQAP